MTFEEVWALSMQGTENAITHSVAKYLYDFASQTLAPGHIVEVGTNRGNSTAFLSHGAAQCSHGPVVFTVDHHLGATEQTDPHVKETGPPSLSTFVERYHRWQMTHVIPIPFSSPECAWAFHQPVGLIFFDAGHDVRSVMKDILAWEQHLLPGGRVVFHDARGQFPGIEYAKGFLGAAGDYTALDMCDNDYAGLFTAVKKTC